ncbi:MAG: hypothetical protein JW891_13060 [Candidatus Lokiarchaeota archaeon]|nr:hypothetical protein [Candidatus Lokiarchaeota archaeon]
MDKSDYIYMIIDNVLVFGINTDLQGEKLKEHLNKYDEQVIKAVAGFSQKFLEHFLIVSKGKTQSEIEDLIKKMENISYMISPMGSLHYLREEQLEYILTKLGSLELSEISEQEISRIADEQIEKQFGGTVNYSESQALEAQLSSAAFYLSGLGFPQSVINQKLDEVRKEPSKLDALFNVAAPSSSNHPPMYAEESTDKIVSSHDVEKAIDGYIESIKQDITEERAKRVAEIMVEIKDYVQESLDARHERVFKMIHPDRLSRALKMLKSVKKKSNRIGLYIEWFFCSHLIENIEFKVEHWQVSSQAGHGSSGVYSAGIAFSRYDQIIREFNDSKLTKVVNICRRILQTPSKKAIQKLGQDLVAETGFDEHLYFTD